MSEYNRVKAVEYANIWWNSYNPRFKVFEDDCTNFVSQCLWAGGAPFSFGERSRGWWYKGEGNTANWSFSWAVAHSLRWYLANSNSGLRATEVANPRDLELGDVICYDFDGDGKWQHNSIVTAKSLNGFPLVNAHTVNSRNRDWSYESSTSWTERIKYKFYHIVDRF